MIRAVPAAVIRRRKDIPVAVVRQNHHNREDCHYDNKPYPLEVARQKFFDGLGIEVLKKSFHKSPSSSFCERDTDVARAQSLCQVGGIVKLAKARVAVAGREVLVEKHDAI